MDKTSCLNSSQWLIMCQKLMGVPICHTRYKSNQNLPFFARKSTLFAAWWLELKYSVALFATIRVASYFSQKGAILIDQNRNKIPMLGLSRLAWNLPSMPLNYLIETTSREGVYISTLAWCMHITFFMFERKTDHFEVIQKKPMSYLRALTLQAMHTW